jgi:hypothetical protein
MGKNMHTILLASVLGSELQLGHLTKKLEILGPGDISIVILNRLEEVAESVPVGTTIALLQVVAGCLVNKLRSPESTIGNIDIDGEASTSSANRCLWLIECQLKSQVLGQVMNNSRCRDEWMSRHPS